MYRRDVPDILQWLDKEGPDGLVTVGAFVLCTIQMPFSRVKVLMEDVKLNKAQSEALWGFKRAGYSHLSDHAKHLYRLLLERTESREDTFYHVLSTPGLGLSKTGFLMQLCGWETACIDLHNMRRFSLNANILKCPPKLKRETKIKKIENYLNTCDKIGTSEWFWDSWCEYIAGNRMNKTLETADIVSKYHKECIF